MIGEAWSTIMATGTAFANASSPQVAIQVGAPGSTGIVEISDMIFTTRGPGKPKYAHVSGSSKLTCTIAPGAIVVEWNVHDPSGKQGVAAVWDTVIRYVTRFICGSHSRVF